MSSSNDSLAMQRITKLVDENSFMEIGSLVQQEIQTLILQTQTHHPTVLSQGMV